MPPRNKFNQEEIISAALDIVRELSADGLTARSLAQRLSSSPKVIFGYFKGMDEVRQKVTERAYELYLSYLNEDMSKGEFPPYKASGMAYIRFADTERELFKLLFMCDRNQAGSVDFDVESSGFAEVLSSSLGITNEEAKLFHLEMWTSVHGIATMIATDFLRLDNELISTVLSDLYNGAKMRFEAKKEN